MKRNTRAKSKKRCVWCLYWSILTAYWHFQVVLECHVTVYDMKTEKRGWICQSEHTCKSHRGTTQHLQGDRQDELRPWTEQQRASLLQEQACLSPHSILGLGSAAVSRGRGGWVWQRSVCVCECTCSRAQLTQSETCCMATVHKGTRLCIRMCQVCLYVWMCVFCVFCHLCASHRQTFNRLYITPYICVHTDCLQNGRNTHIYTVHFLQIGLL